MKEKDMVKADFPVLIIMCFERLWGGLSLTSGLKSSKYAAGVSIALP
jgi:hypothetical protein